MNIINDINTLRKFIKQKGSCSNIECDSCISALSKNPVKSCEQLHLLLGTPTYNKRVTSENEIFEAQARKRLREIFLDIKRKNE